MSAEIMTFARDAGSFTPEQLAAMGTAFDNACKGLHDKGQPACVREIVARRIVDLAKAGELDPNEICRRVLAAFGMPT